MCAPPTRNWRRRRGPSAREGGQPRPRPTPPAPPGAPAHLLLIGWPFSSFRSSLHFSGSTNVGAAMAADRRLLPPNRAAGAAKGRAGAGWRAWKEGGAARHAVVHAAPPRRRRPPARRSRCSAPQGAGGMGAGPPPQTAPAWSLHPSHPPVSWNASGRSVGYTGGTRRGTGLPVMGGRARQRRRARSGAPRRRGAGERWLWCGGGGARPPLQGLLWGGSSDDTTRGPAGQVTRAAQDDKPKGGWGGSGAKIAPLSSAAHRG
jgi:hypothetical protein